MLHIASGKAFTGSKKSIGPNINPCETPKSTDLADDVAPKTITRCFPFNKYGLSQWRNSGALIGLCIFIYPCSARLISFEMTLKTTDFKRNSLGRTRIYEYIYALVTLVPEMPKKFCNF